MARNDSAATFLVKETAHVASWDTGTSRLTGVRPEDAVGKHCYECATFHDLRGTCICRPDCPVLLLAEHGDVAVHEGVFLVRADGERRPVFVTHIVFRDRDGSSSILHVVRPLEGAEALTLSEAQVLDLMVKGLSSREIAQRLSVTFNTVRTHVAHVLQKLGATSRLEAMSLVRATWSPGPSRDGPSPSHPPLEPGDPP